MLRDAAATRGLLPLMLRPKWERSYKVTRSLENGAYSLKDMEKNISREAVERRASQKVLLVGCKEKIYVIFFVNTKDRLLY